MQTLATLTRHIVTYLVGLLVTWMAIYLTRAELATAAQMANALIEPLVIIAGFVAVIVTRLLMPFLDKIFRTGSGEKSSGVSGGMLPLAIGWIGFAAVASMGALPSCSALGGEYPVAITVRLGK